MYTTNKWITRINTFKCSTVVREATTTLDDCVVLTYMQIYPAPGPELAGRVALAPVAFEERAISFEEIYKGNEEEEVEAEIQEELAVATVMHIGGWMASVLGRKSHSTDEKCLNGSQRKKKDGVKRQQAAVLCIQGAWRMRRARRARDALLQRKADRQRHASAIVIQCAYRRSRARQEFSNRIMKERAAVVVTSFVRRSAAVMAYTRRLAAAHPHMLYVDVKEATGVAVTARGEGGLFMTLSVYDAIEKADEARQLEASSPSSFFKQSKKSCVALVVLY